VEEFILKGIFTNQFIMWMGSLRSSLGIQRILRTFSSKNAF
jgi:hypothetical protein